MSEGVVRCLCGCEGVGGDVMIDQRINHCHVAMVVVLVVVVCVWCVGCLALATFECGVWLCCVHFVRLCVTAESVCGLWNVTPQT